MEFSREHLLLIKPHSIHDGTEINVLEILTKINSGSILPEELKLSDSTMSTLTKLAFSKLIIDTIDISDAIRNRNFLNVLYPTICESYEYYPTLQVCLLGIVRIVRFVSDVSEEDWGNVNRALFDLRGSTEVWSYDKQMRITEGTGIRGAFQGQIIASETPITLDTLENQSIRRLKVANNIIHVPDTYEEVRNIINFLNL